MAYSEKGLEVYEMLKKHLEDHDIHFTSHDEDLVITMTVQGDDLPQPTIVRVMDDREIIQICSPIPSHIPEDKRMEAAVAVAVANYGMINGSFDLDMHDGEIRFRIAQNYAGMELSDEFVQYLFAVTFITTDRYNDKFFMLGKGMLSLEQFIADEEK